MVKRKQSFPQQQIPSDATEVSQLILAKGVDTFINFPPLPPKYFEIKKDHDQKKENNLTSTITCPYCEIKTYGTLMGLKSHLQDGRCTNSPPLLHICKICDTKLDNHKAASIHITDVHLNPYVQESRSLRTPTKPRSSLVVGEDEDEDEENEGEEGEIEDNISDDDFDESSILRGIGSGKGKPGRPYSHTSPATPLSKTVQQTYTFKVTQEEVLSKITNLTPDTSPDTEKTITQLISNGVLQRTSCKFSIDSDSLARPAKVLHDGRGRPKDKTHHYDYASLGLFESKSSPGCSRSYTAFVGCAVWALEWCPRPTVGPASEQFLAVATHNREHLLEPGAVYEETTMLQIWNCGFLPLKPTGDEIPQSPFFSLGIVLNASPIHDMNWRGVFGEQLVNSKSLGDLAIASGAGEALVLPIPIPESSYPDYKVVKPNSYLRLVPNQNAAMPFGQCLSVCWSVYQHQPIVAAGFVSGEVAIFNVNAKSNIVLGQKIDGCQVIYPIRCFNAHSQVVRSITFCPYNPRLFATGSYDRSVKVWDMFSLDAPIMDSGENNPSFVYEMEWPCNFNGLYVATGCEFAMPGNHGCVFFDLNDPSWPVSTIVPFKVTSWSITLNHWLNSTVCSDASGSVVLSAHKNPTIARAKLKRQRRFMLYQCRPKWQFDEEMNAKKKKSKKNEIKEEPKEAISANKDWGDDYKLKFEDMQLHQLYRYNRTEAYQRSVRMENFPDSMVELPVSAVLKTRWNPNFSSFSWIATATRSGFLRLHCVSGMITIDVMSVVRDCIAPK